jgi:SAM-dependent methyltransferase
MPAGAQPGPRRAVGEAAAADLSAHPAASGIGSLTAYWRFYRAVAAAQLTAWLSGSQRRDGLLVDISGPHLSCAAQAAAAGQRVVRVRPAPPQAAPGPPGSGAPARVKLAAGRSGASGGTVERRGATRSAAPRSGAAHASRPRRGRVDSPPRSGLVTTLYADPTALPFIGDQSVDGVIADDRTLSRCLFAEQAVAEVARVLRPGGRLLACFDSLVLGMAILAEQHHWAELSDLRSAEVVLVPWPDGTITRCFGVEHLRELFADAGLEVSWIRPRTVLSPTTVEHILSQRPAALPHLVRAELGADPDDSVGIHLIVNARKPSKV